MNVKNTIVIVIIEFLEEDWLFHFLLLSFNISANKHHQRHDQDPRCLQDKRHPPRDPRGTGIDGVVWVPFSVALERVPDGPGTGAKRDDPIVVSDHSLCALVERDALRVQGRPQAGSPRQRNLPQLQLPNTHLTQRRRS